MSLGGRDYINNYNGNLTKEVLMLDYSYTTSSLFFEKEALIEIGGFDESFTRHQDYELLLRYFERYEIGNIEEPLFLRGKNKGENFLTGKKAEESKKSFLKKFKNTILAVDKCEKGYKKKIYVRNYMKLFKIHCTNKDFILCLKNFLKSFAISPKLCIEEIKVKRENAIKSEPINIEQLPNLLVDEENGNEIEISIIIPAYNVEKYISECVNSVLNNTFKNIEIICINDGSTDNTLQILNEISKKDERLKIYSQSNKGLGAARNKGVSLAKGKYVWFLDADDTINIRALEYICYELKNNSLDMLFFNANTYFDNEIVKKEYGSLEKIYFRKYNYYGIKKGKNLFIQLNNNKDYIPSACLYVANRNFLNKNNLKFFEGIIHEDNLYTLQCMTLAKRVMYKNIFLYNRRIRENSIMTSENTKKTAQSFLVILSELSSFVKKYNLIQDDKYYNEFLERCNGIVGQAFNKINQITKEELLDLFKETDPQKKYEREDVFFHMLINLRSKAWNPKSIKSKIINKIKRIIKRIINLT